MGLVSPSQSNSGDTIEASDINNPINQLAAVINGGIDATNIAANAIGTTQLADGSATTSKLSTSAITLGYATASTDQNSITTESDVTGLTTTITAPTNGRRIKISWNLAVAGNTTNGIFDVFIYDGSTKVKSFQYISPNNSNTFNYSNFMSLVPTSGSHTYKLRIIGATESINISNTFSAGELLVEAI